MKDPCICGCGEQVEVATVEEFERAAYALDYARSLPLSEADAELDALCGSIPSGSPLHSWVLGEWLGLLGGRPDWWPSNAAERHAAMERKRDGERLRQRTRPKESVT